MPKDAILLTHPKGKLELHDALRLQLAAIEVKEGEAILLATRESLNTPMRHELTQKLQRAGYKPRIGITNLGVLKSLYELNAEALKKDTAESSDEAGLKAEFSNLVSKSIEIDASDIHIERRADKASVRMRRHGELVKVMSDWSPKHAEDMCRAIYNSVADSGSKSLSFDPKAFQQAAINITINNMAYRIRYQAAPAFPDGSDTVLRVLPTGKNMNVVPLEKLGYHKSHSHALRAMISRASGIIFLAGTTGSGKTTTINNLMLMRLHENPGRKALSIEDPPEYVIPGVSQIPVPRLDGKEGNPFLAAMRAVMRMDPDLIMVGEVRDIESAKLVVSMVQSGHQVMSTVHTPSARAIPARLYDMGVERSVLGSDDFFAGLIYQKLVPVLCQKCCIPLLDAKAAGYIEADLWERLSQMDEVTEKDYPAIKVRGGGCEDCGGMGIVGRTVCAEVILPDFTMLGLFRKGDDVEVYRYWRSKRVIGSTTDLEGCTAFDHAIIKMKQGLLSPSDIEESFGYLDLQKIREGKGQPVSEALAAASGNTAAPDPVATAAPVAPAVLPVAPAAPAAAEPVAVIAPVMAPAAESTGAMTS